MDSEFVCVVLSTHVHILFIMTVCLIIPFPPPPPRQPHTTRIRAGENLDAVFTAINPTQKIPVIVDPNAVTPGMDVTAQSATVFESGACLMYLAERYDDLLPKSDIIMKYKAIEWTFWGSTEFSVQAKQYGFYYKYCTHKLEYCEARHRDKLIRLFCALELQLQSHNKHWITGDQYTIAGMFMYK
jgi:GST-like protein